MHLKRLACTLCVVAAIAGCQHSESPDEKAQAQIRWNDARAAVMTSLALDQYRNGSFDRCRKTIDDALKLSPKSVPLHVLSAKVAIEQGQTDLADSELAVAQQLAPGDPEPCYLRGVVYERWQKYDKALEYYRLAWSKNSQELSYLLAQAEMLVAMDRPDDALRLLQDKVGHFEHSAAIRDAVGQLLMQSGRFAEAVPMFRQASILSEDDGSVHERLAMALYWNKQYREAGEILSRMTGSDPYSKRADLFLVLGECQLQQAQAHDARSSFQIAVQLDGENSLAWRNLGRATLQCGDMRRAEMALERAISLDPSNSETQLLMGYLRLRQNKLNLALAAFDKATSLDARDGVSLCMSGYVLEKMGEPKKAAELYAQALRLNPSDKMAKELIAGVNPSE